MSASIPLVVPVSETLLPSWRAFTGETGLHVPPEADKIETWCRVQAPRPSGREETVERMEGDALSRRS